MKQLINLSPGQLASSIVKFLNWIIITLVISSCQKVIDINLNSSAPKLVVEGNVNNCPGPYVIKLSRTTNFFDNNFFQPVNGTTVILADNAGNQEVLNEKTPGIYSTANLKGTIGRSYTLYFSDQGQNFSATQNMMDTVAIDSMSYHLRILNTKSRYNITCSFTDPASNRNYYGFRVYHNRALTTNVVENRLITDQLSNGGAFHIDFSREDWIKNDTIGIELIAFNKSAYDFYNTLQQTLASGSPFSAPPANPYTDINNGALGFFGAFAITSSTIVLR